MEDIPESDRVRILTPGQRAQALAALAPVPLSRRMLAGLPSAVADVVMAATCLAAWIAPTALPADVARTTALVMLIEFLSIHGTLMVPLLGWLLSHHLGRAGWALAVLVYLGFAIGMSAALETWWPTVFFAWLLLSRYVLTRWNLGGHDEHIDAGALWLVSLLLWLGVVFAAVLLPVPELGWANVGIGYGLPGGGIFVREPERLLACATLYFLGLAAFKLRARPGT